MPASAQILDSLPDSVIIIDAGSDSLDRKLGQVAEQSGQQHDNVKSVAVATEQLSVSISEVAHSASDTTDAAHQAEAAVEEGNQKIATTSEITTRLVDAVSCSGATAEHQQAGEEVARNMERISALIEGNLAAGDEARQAVAQLRNTSASLAGMIGGFQLYRQD